MNQFESLIIASGLSSFYVKLILGFLSAFFVCYLSVPTIVKISFKKNLMDEPGVRSSHLRKIPNLGGVAIFYAIAICASVFAYELFDKYKFLFASLVILLYIGVMDDIVVMRAYKKLIAQIVVSFLIVVGSDVRIRSLFGLFGIEDLNYIVSVLFSVFTFIILINAFNLIDGIDGLAGGYAILCSLMFGASYFRLGEEHYSLVIFSAVIVGAVLGFLRYNLSNYRIQKIFMGDTGSMILGFLLAFMAISFIDIFIEKEPSVSQMVYHLDSAPVIAVAILMLPIVDTLNVIIIRLLNKQSVLVADKNHIHHKLLDLGLSHGGCTGCILSYYSLAICLIYFCRHLENNVLLLLVLFIGFFGAYLPTFFKLIKTNNNG